MASIPENAANSSGSWESPNGSVNSQISVEADLNQKSIPLRSTTDTKTSSGEAQQSSSNLEIDHSKEQNADDDGDDDAERLEGDYGKISNLPPETAEKKKKKKKKRKPASQRGLDKPTGFESFFADTPLTPEQYAEERELYDPKSHFIDRILTAIARFERTRKLSPERRDVLFKYLTYGGVECGPNAFQGGQDLSNMDKSTIASILSNASITEEKRDLETETSLYAVDFEACMKGFLSRHAGPLYGFEQREVVDRVTSTLERFMDYLLQHDVCPEYSADVLKTRNFCRYDANPELWSIAEASRRLPGDFNRACSTLFGGQYSEYDGETWWGDPNNTEAHFVGLKPEEASQILQFGIAGAATEQVYTFYLDVMKGSKNLEVVSVENYVGLEITRVEPPTAECKEIYTANSAHFRPVGRVYAKAWKNPEAPPEDLTAEEHEQARREADKPTTGQEEKDDEYLFFIESIIQEDLRVGMKLEATVRTLNCGLMYFDHFLTLYPTFDTYLPNEAMMGWKKPRPVKGAFDFVEEEELVTYKGGDDHESKEHAAGDVDGSVDSNQNGGGALQEDPEDDERAGLDL
ncbi:hypothetical protein LTR84_005525 [Exophiala bonariae]|uniref:Argonaute complex, subunit Arb1 n=1 Tax=Exophiala bonariae TaxID=1690606 RepID=A0AAV9N405_9EURO|nr:hypothetical protein LTR84_005525 [Exophiala bonariae]